MRLTEKYELKRLCYAYENLDKIIDKKTYDECGSYYKLILQRFIIDDGERDIYYKYSQYTNYGRRYSNGIQPFKQVLRNFLLKDSGVIDIDMKNAHPSILQHICDKYNIKTKFLKEYVEDRKAVLNKHFEIELHAGQDIKKKILIATNMDRPFQTKNEWLKCYIHEISVIKDKIINHKDFAKIKKDTEAKKQSSENKDSSCLNRILCKYESEIMDVVCESIKSNGHEPLALMFDGILTRCDGDVDDLISDINEFIQTEYSSYIVLEKKPYDSIIDMGDYEMSIEKIHADIDSKRTRTKLFYDLFDPIKIIHPCLYGIRKEDGLYEFYEKAKFIQSVEHIKYGIRDEDGNIVAYKSVVEDFMNGEIEVDRIKTEIINSPVKNKNQKKHNLWTDWSINSLKVKDYKYDENAVEYYKNHLSSLCNHEEPIIKAMNLWIAHMFKYPENKSFVPIFVGRQGAGKDLLIALITFLMGKHKHFESVTPEKDVWGDGFNPMMKNAFLVHLSEFGRRNTQDYVGAIKSLSTSGSIRINEKNKGQYMIDSFHRFLGASNYNEPIPIEADNRRYMLIMT
jgi:hypothetical protein